MAYTASALSFVFVNLGKPVILVGSMLPFGEVRPPSLRAPPPLTTSLRSTATPGAICLYQ